MKQNVVSTMVQLIRFGTEAGVALRELNPRNHVIASFVTP